MSTHQPNWNFDPAGKGVAAIRQEFANRLHYFLAEKGWSQSELARRSDMHRDNISRYCKAERMPNREGAYALAAALEVDVSAVVPGETNRPAFVTDTPEGASISPPQPDGKVRLKINQKVPQKIAYQILGLLSETE